MEESHLNQRISPKFVAMKIFADLTENIIGLIVVFVLYWVDQRFNWPQWAEWILHVLLVLSILFTIWALIEPRLIYKNWRYDLDSEYLHLRFGIFIKKWVTVPMTKIQSVTTSQGPIMKRFQLRQIKVETMGSSHKIPGLDEEVAERLKEEISQFAKLREVDS